MKRGFGTAAFLGALAIAISASLPGRALAAKAGERGITGALIS